MIDKKLFMSCMNSIIEYGRMERRIYDVSDGAFDLIEFEELQLMIDSFTDLLAYCVGSEPDEYVGDDIKYFLYELDCGKDPLAKDCITLKDGTKISITNLDELWDYLVMNHPELANNEED